MALTSGFFDAQLVNDQPDRAYSSEHFGSLFDGVITDGIFKKYGTAFNVTPGTPDTSTGKLRIYVGIGRAWFNKTWTLNSSPLLLEVDQPSATAYRMDAVVLEVNTNLAVRTNTIKVIKGQEFLSENVQAPALTRSTTVNQYLIATIKVKASLTTTNDAMEITDKRNTGGQSAPYCEVVTPTDASIESIINSLEAEFNSYQKRYQADFEDWMEGIIGQLGTLSNEQTVRLSLMIGEIYRSEYISGEYPYVDNDGGLYLSLNDNGERPSIDVNFGYASLPYSANSRANEVVVQTSEYTIVEE